MSECSKCPFCEQTFTVVSEFWDHINTLDCKSEPSSSSAPPLYSSNPEVSQPEKEAVSVHPSSSNDVLERVSALSPSIEYHNGNARPFEINEMKITLSSSLPPPPETQPTIPVANGISNGNLFSKKEFPVKATEAAPVSQPPKWKCILCDIEFTEKQAMIGHVRSAEHEAKIPTNTTAGNRSQSITVTPANPTNNFNDTANTGIKKDELVAIVRQIVREELQSMFQSYFDGDKSPKRSSSNTMETNNSDTRFIKMQAGFIHCEACDCSITSVANLSLHVEGKKHRANVAKLTTPASMH
ncbi:unnamed protein product [Hymenolepis diminuta]|uniref:C2H2-type domain-containing protein n=1 Tax=Hymenolepis diminuta TaxID=6216 RepID=A0A0R3SVL2_HYMDI|nr:unnamed protein product [Hymenolepis diminuta]VUZ39083.1 unnamed protein product [Hymenolepis diminuta]